MENWKQRQDLQNCERKSINGQKIKQIDYNTEYVEYFLNRDELKDWDSSKHACQLIDWCVKEGYINPKKHKSLLDIGTKDGVLPDYVQITYNINSFGIEISERYVEYAKSKNRPVKFGNISDDHVLNELSNPFWITFAHKVLGLTEDFKSSLLNMIRLTKKNGIIISLDGFLPETHTAVKKHYSLLESPLILKNWLDTDENFKNVDVLYFGKGPLSTNSSDENLTILKKR